MSAFFTILCKTFAPIILKLIKKTMNQYVINYGIDFACNYMSEVTKNYYNIYFKDTVTNIKLTI